MTLTRARVFDFTHAILRKPGRNAVKGIRVGSGPDPDYEGLLAEHAAYAAALEDAGLKLTMLEPRENYPDALFVEDPALVFPEAAVLLRPGAPAREHEAELLHPTLAARFERVLHLPAGYADGGDVLVMPDKVLIGLSARTDREGAAALAGLLGALGRRVVIVETPDAVLHLKTACSLVDEETVLATGVLAASGIFVGYRVLEIPAGEEGGANVLRANCRILAGKRFPRIADLLNAHGVNVVLLDNTEIYKIDAGFTCMSLRWRSY